MIATCVGKVGRICNRDVMRPTHGRRACRHCALPSHWRSSISLVLFAVIGAEAFLPGIYLSDYSFSRGHHVRAQRSEAGVTNIMPNTASASLWLPSRQLALHHEAQDRSGGEQVLPLTHEYVNGEYSQTTVRLSRFPQTNYSLKSSPN